MVEACLAIDIGGTKVEVGVVTRDGDIAARRVTSSVDPAPADGEDLFDRVHSLIAPVVSEASAADDDLRIECVGVGSGGPMAPLGEAVSPLNIRVWRDFPLRSRLASSCLGICTDVHIDNDAKALALAEGWLGAARGSRNFMAMVVSTGVGGGVVLDGRLLDGRLGNAGHIGHLVVNPEGREHAGILGTVEGEASGTAIAALTGQPAQEADGPWRIRTGTLVGRAIGGVANLLDLDLVVVAGSVALGYGEMFFEAAQAEVDRVAKLDHSLGTRVVPAGLRADGPLIGAAAVGFRGRGETLGVILPR